ncbi:MAG: dethiobiotin synthase [Acidimicrobiia bacterium]|nr:dethiobiotin synthase [Acidimicrobiia bacterium]
MRRGVHRGARKPVQSFAPGESTDAEVLAAAAGVDSDEVCPAHRWLEAPMAPPMAAALLDRPAFTVAELVDEVQWPLGVGVGLVESVGGVRSPLADDGDTVDLVARLGADGILLVADAGLGTISDVRLAADALADSAVLVLLNRFDPDVDLHRRNEAWLREREGLLVETDVTAMVGRSFDWCRPSAVVPRQEV